jgi:hypothetical protein
VLIDRFISRATRSRLKPFVVLAQTITKHHDGILAAIRLGITQGRTEALNNKVRLVVVSQVPGGLAGQESQISAYTRQPAEPRTAAHRGSRLSTPRL